MSKKLTDIVTRLRDPMREVDFGDRLMAADEIERLRAALQRDILADRKTTKNLPVQQKSADILPDIKQAVRTEREAILKIIASARADDHLYDADYVLQNVADAIRARGEQQ